MQDDSAKSAPAKLTSTIYTHTVHFLLQTNALQVYTLHYCFSVRWLHTGQMSVEIHILESAISLCHTDAQYVKNTLLKFWKVKQHFPFGQINFLKISL